MTMTYIKMAIRLALTALKESVKNPANKKKLESIVRELDEFIHDNWEL